MAGNYVGSSYGWATTRDWAKFGLLYLHQGNWNGNKYLMKGKIHHNLPIDLREDMAFWLNAGGHFQMYQEICITVAVFKANGGDYSVA
jgi:CubicO group peptidase (beta-lactamase class C family)